MKNREFLTLNRMSLIRSTLLCSRKVIREIEKHNANTFGILLLMLFIFIITTSFFVVRGDNEYQKELTEVFILNLFQPLSFFELIGLLLLCTSWIMIRENRSFQHCEDLENLRFAPDYPLFKILAMESEELRTKTKEVLVELAEYLIHEERKYGPDSINADYSRKCFKKTFDVTKRLKLHEEENWGLHFRLAHERIDTHKRKVDMAKDEPTVQKTNIV